MRLLYSILIMLLPVVFAFEVVPDVLKFEVPVGGHAVERLFVQGVENVEFVVSPELRSFVHVVRRSSSVFEIVVLVPESEGEGVVFGTIVVLASQGGVSGRIVERVVPVEIVVKEGISPTGFAIGGVEEPVVSWSLGVLPLLGVVVVLVFLGNVFLRKQSK